MRKNKKIAILCIGLAGVITIAGCTSNTLDAENTSALETQGIEATGDTLEEASGENPSEDAGSVRVKVDPSEIIYADQYDFEKIKPEENEFVEFSQVVEAEEAGACEGVKHIESESCSGGSYIDVSNNSEFSITVDIPASQYYKISVCHKAGSHKENPILFNGAKVCDIYSESGDFVVNEFDGVFLEAGENVITLGEGWSWFSMDYIQIENGNTLDDSLYAVENKLLSNPYANLKTQNIYQYLQAVYGKRTLAGQCTDYGNNTETDALYNGLGKYPAVRTFDFIFDSFSYCKGLPKAKDVALAKEWSANGGLVVFDWHWYAPADGCAFYTESTEFTIEKARPKEDVNLATMDLDEIRGLYKEEKISIETVMLFVDIDNIASLLQDLEDADVSVLWRPLHEASGGWFWWGATGADDYIWLWKTLYERLTDYHGLDNLIWVWNAQDPEWYPGDAYCDIAALDVYGQAHDYGVSPSTFADVHSWVDGQKMVTMSECATMPDPDLIVRDNAYWLWFAVWNWDYIVKNGTPELSDAYTELDMMKKVYDSEVVITLDELPIFD